MEGYPANEKKHKMPHLVRSGPAHFLSGGFVVVDKRI